MTREIAKAEVRTSSVMRLSRRSSDEIMGISTSVSASAMSCGSVMSSCRKSTEWSSFWHEMALYTLFEVHIEGKW